MTTNTRVLWHSWTNLRGLRFPQQQKKIEIQPKDAPFKVLEISFFIYFFFQFELHSNVSNILIWVTFQFECYLNLKDIPIWVTFQFEWHFNLNNIQFDWHCKLSDIFILLIFNLIDIRIWGTFQFELCSNWSVISIWVTLQFE